VAVTREQNLLLIQTLEEVTPFLDQDDHEDVLQHAQTLYLHRIVELILTDNISQLREVAKV
jgi:hypothetical protein